MPAPRSIDPEISVALESAILWGLELDVESRPQDVAEFENALAGEKGGGSPPVAGTRAARGRLIPVLLVGGFVSWALIDLGIRSNQPVPGPPTGSPSVEASAIGLARQADELYVTGDYSSAFPLYLRAAAEGHVFSMSRVGFMYYSGEGVEQDYAQAARWYQQSAEGGDAGAMTFLGVLYELGRGVEQDYEAAVGWYRQAAEGGSAGAKGSLGSMYQFGQGVEQNDEEAVRWFRQGADGGDGTAMVNLGSMYERGLGVGENRAEAIQWYQRAADLGEDRATDALARLGVR